MESKFDIEKLLVKLYLDQKDCFYAYLFYMVDRISMKDLPYLMGVGIQNSRIKLVYNGAMIKDYINKHSEAHMITVLKHEALHLINKHLIRVTNKQRENQLEAKMWNIAQDCSVNQLLNLKHIQDIGGVTLDSFKTLLKSKSPDFNLLSGQTSEYYYELLKQEKEAMEKNNKEGAQGLVDVLDNLQMDSHDMFGEMDMLEQAMFESTIKKAYERAMREGADHLPFEIKNIFNMLYAKNKVNWRREMSRFAGDGIRAEKKPSRSKINRRYGIKFAGKKKDYLAKILTVIDTSGSMTDGMIQQAINEVYGIYNASPNLQIDIVECDTTIKDVFTYDGKKKFPIKGRGGTDFQPALDYAKNHKYDGIIFLTDGGYFTKPVNTGVPILWGLIGVDNFDIDFGTVLKIED